MNESFVFYRSFAEAIESLPAEQYKAIMIALTQYALNGDTPDLSDAVVKALFTLMKPQIDANQKRRDAGKKGGEQTQANVKQTQANVKQTEANVKQTQANVNVNANVNANVNVNENANANVNANANGEVEKLDANASREKTPGETLAKLLPDYPFDSETADMLTRWCDYHAKEKHKPYKQGGLTALLNQTARQYQHYGGRAVCDVIELSMSNGWQGICWDKIKQDSREAFVDKWRYA